MNHVKIDLERIVSDIDRNIFGGYIEFGPLDIRFDYLNVGNTSIDGKDDVRSDVQSALERMNLANIRFPGGNFASAYRWMNGVGPREKRPTIFDLAGECSVDNRYGTNEFIRFCRKFKIEPYLCVNCGDGDMREAADWVEYCNGTGDAALVKLRREHGFAAPHKVKYWGIGNEVDGPWQIGYKTAQEYARAVTEYSKVMKRVDPDIKLIAAGVSLWEDYPLPEFKTSKTEWVERAQLVLEQAGDRIDYLAIHRYANPYDDDPFENYMAFAENYNEHLNAYDGLIRAVSLERGIRHGIGIAVDEWGLTRFHAENDVPVNVGVDISGCTRITTPDKSPRTRRRRVINLEDALVTALHLNCFIRHASSVRIANFHRIPRIGNNLTGPDSPLLLPTILYPFELYSHTCGQQALDVFWHGDTFSGAYGNRTYSGIRNLDVAATLDAGRKQLVVYVVNQSKDKVIETTIALTSGQFTGNVKISVVNGPDIKAENTIEEPNQVGTKKSNLTVSGKSFTYTFEPHSVTALVCAVS